MPRAAFANLGCKVNQYETERIAETFAARGFEIGEFDSPADVYVINTCSVTGAADRKSRHLARRVARQNPDAKIVLTGCFAQLSVDTNQVVDGASLLIPNRQKMLTAEITLATFPALGESAEQPTLTHTHLAVFPEDAGLAPTGAHERGRTRATLKVQDGCQHFCAFCSIPYTRSIMASRGLEALVEEARMVANNGVREVVVTGICVGAYRDGDRTLPDLLRAVADLPGSERVRLSSIQPIEVDDRLIDAVASHPNICPHLHLSLQSGSDGVLAAMRRPYDTAFYRGIVAKLRTRVPSIAITTDIIVGFPGETDADFETSAAFAREMAFARIHVFRYSPRKRTFAAENLRDDVSAEQKDARHAALSAIGAQTQADFARKLVGQTVDVLVERGGRGDGYRVGYTSSYVRVNFTCGNEIAPGQIVPVRISEIDDSGDCIGRI